MMSKIDELLHEHFLHSVRSDGSQMIALETGQSQVGPEWEVLIVRKDGVVENDGTLTLDTGEKTVLRKIYDAERLKKLAALHDFVEWRSGAFEEHPDEQVFTLQEQLQRTEHDLQDMKSQYASTEEQLQGALKQVQDLNKLTASQRKKERAAPRIDIDELANGSCSLLLRRMFYLSEVSSFYTFLIDLCRRKQYSVLLIEW